MQTRNCAWTAEGSKPSSRVVWARRDLIAFHCPKSIITAQSLSFLEQFRIWKAFGGGIPWSIEAKAGEAILVLEEASQKENERGQN